MIERRERRVGQGVLAELDQRLVRAQRPHVNLGVRPKGPDVGLVVDQSLGKKRFDFQRRAI